ncbi:MAG: HAMP domain-containing protein [Cellvibrionaceae bacterium]
MNINSFSLKIMLGILFCVSLPLSGLWLANGHFSKVIEKEIDWELEQTAEFLSLSANSWADINLRVLNHHAALPEMKSFDQVQQSKILKTIESSYEWAYSVYTVGKDGYIAARSDGKSVLKPDGTKKYFRGDREYMTEIIEGADVGQQVLISGRLGVPVLIMCSPINKENFNSSDAPYGALCMAMKLTVVSNVVEDLRIGETGFAMLLDDKNKLIAHGNTLAVFENLQDFSDSLLIKSSVNNGQFSYTLDGVKKVVYSKRITQGWRMVVERDFDEAYSQLIKSNQNFLYILVATILISILIALFIAKAISRPVKNITEVTDQMSKGKLGMKMKEISRGDEIGDLARSIERMGISVGIAIKKLKDKK